MKNVNRTFPSHIIKGLLALLPLFLVVSCATTIPELQVQYLLPPPSDQLKGRVVSMTVEDQRTTQSILGRGAQDEFKGFSNSVSLSVADTNQKKSSLGIFQVPALIKEAFKRRLENAGVNVLLARSHGVPSLVIVLKEFSLDLVGREWQAKMRYEARLTGEKGGVATQFVNGEAERYKLIGRENADALMGEVFTDMVNSLNLARLFDQAGL